MVLFASCVISLVIKDKKKNSTRRSVVCTKVEEPNRIVWAFLIKAVPKAITSMYWSKTLHAEWIDASHGGVGGWVTRKSWAPPPVRFASTIPPRCTRLSLSLSLSLKRCMRVERYPTEQGPIHIIYINIFPCVRTFHLN